MSSKMFRAEGHTLQMAGDRCGVALVLFLAAMMIIVLAIHPYTPGTVVPVSQDRIAAANSISARDAPIVFVRRDEGGSERWMKHLYLMTPDGSGQRRIAREVQGWEASWAPDGDRLAFTCPVQGNLEICVMQADGADLAQLTLNPAMDEHPAWSPDGARLLFDSNRDGSFQIYAMSATGLGPFALTHTATNEMEPAWSPDGQHIAFTSDRVKQDAVLITRDIFIMNLDGSDQTNLTHNATACVSESPAWSPDSAQIAFSSNCDAPWFQIYAMPADGSTPRRLTTSEAHDRHPAWAPDGAQIVFDSTRDLPDSGIRMIKDQPQVYVMNADGSAVRRLTSDVLEFSSHPAWNWKMRNPVPAQ